MGSSTEREIKINRIENFRSVIGKLLDYEYVEQSNSKKRAAEVSLNEEDFQMSQKRLKMI